MKLLILAAALLAGGMQEAQASAWTQVPGEGFYQLGSQLSRGRVFVEPDGSQITIPTLANYTFSFYGEYGLREGLTLVGYVPFLRRVTLNKQVGKDSGFVFFAGDAKTGFADVDLGLRYRLWQMGATVVSAGLMLGVPTGDDRQENGLLTGDGEFNQLLTVQAGHSLYPRPAYWQIAAGFNHRTGGYADEVRFSVEGGYTAAGRLTLSVRLGSVQSLRNGRSGVMGGMGGLFANDQSFLTYGSALTWALGSEAGLSLGATGVARVRNGLEAPQFSLSLFARR